MSEQREAFEAWAESEELLTLRDDDHPDLYLLPTTKSAWWAWEAAQAAMPVDKDGARHRLVRAHSILRGVSPEEWAKKEAVIDAEIASTGGAA